MREEELLKNFLSIWGSEKRRVDTLYPSLSKWLERENAFLNKIINMMKVLVMSLTIFQSLRNPYTFSIWWLLFKFIFGSIYWNCRIGLRTKQPWVTTDWDPHNTSHKILTEAWIPTKILAWNHLLKQWNNVVRTLITDRTPKATLPKPLNNNKQYEQQWLVTWRLNWKLIFIWNQKEMHFFIKMKKF